MKDIKFINRIENKLDYLHGRMDVFSIGSLQYEIVKDYILNLEKAIEEISDRDKRIAILEKALELACAATCRMCGEDDCKRCNHKSKNSYKHLIKQAEAELNDNRTELL